MDLIDHGLPHHRRHVRRSLRLNEVEHLVNVDVPVLERLDCALEHFEARTLCVPAEKSSRAPVHQCAPSVTTMAAASTSVITTRA